MCAVFFLLDIIKVKRLFKQIHCMSVAQLFIKVRTAQLVSVCTSLRCISLCMHSYVCFNVLTYATPYKQCSMQTVARLPSDKAPEQEKESAL